MFRRTVVRASCALLSLLATAVSYAQQRGPAPDPLVRENATQKVAAHTYVIPDGNVGLVPNVGIVVGSKATLVIDPGLGRHNGETVLKEVAKISRNDALFIASTHFHPEHTTGYVAFPAGAKYINSNRQEAELEQNGMQMVRTFSSRSPLTAGARAAALKAQGVPIDQAAPAVQAEVVASHPTWPRANGVAAAARAAYNEAR
jgi:hypothetical protein